jgi:hypothetical protein
MLLLGLPLPLLPLKLLLSLLRARGHVLHVLCLQKQGVQRRPPTSRHHNFTCKQDAGPATYAANTMMLTCKLIRSGSWVQCQAMPAYACTTQSGHEQVHLNGQG